MCVCIIPAPSELCTLSLHAALPIFACAHDAEAGPDLVAELGLDLVEVDRELAIALQLAAGEVGDHFLVGRAEARSEEHTSELQSRENLVCRLLLEKKKRLAQ